MPQVKKIDSNFTGLSIAEEASIGVLPETPIWIPLEPNSYADFGGQLTTGARKPINNDRQRKKGATMDLDASGGFNNDLTQNNLQTVLQGFVFADFRLKGEEFVTAVDLDTTNPDEFEVAATAGFLVNSLILASGFSNSGNNGVFPVTAVTTDASVEVATGTLTAEASPPAGAKIVVIGHRGAAGDIDVDASGALPAITSTSLNFTTLGLSVGEWIFLGGDTAGTFFTNDENNGFKRISSIAANRIEFDKSDVAMVTEASTSETIHMYFGRVLKNEVGSSIVRRSYQLERTLGVPDSDEPTEVQAEYLIGSVPNQITFNIPQAGKVTCDLSFMSIDHETVDAATGPKAGTRLTLIEEDAINTSSDFSRINMSLVTPGSEAPTPLFAYVTDLTININNNVSPNKAVGTLGAFDVSVGGFDVGGKVTAYFSNISAIAAVRNNSDVTMDFALVKNNSGILVDIPLISLGDGRANIVQDQPITLPINMDAVSGAKVNEDMDHTVLMMFFDYLPDLADA